jgi:phosphatidylserine decarboxylase
LRFAREGYPFIGAGALLAVAGWTAVGLGVGGAPASVAGGLFTALTLFTVWFFRDPDQPTPMDPGLVIAPGQGRITDVLEVEEPSFLGGMCRRITIFLNVFDVHVQRAPVAGTVAHREYRPGKYMVAWKEKASQDNEQASLGISTPHGKVLVRQIAGLVARRIVTYPKEGEQVGRGDRIGLIRFGSRVDLFIPMDWPVTCAVGDKAVAGLTVLAKQPEEVA